VKGMARSQGYLILPVGDPGRAKQFGGLRAIERGPIGESYVVAQIVKIVQKVGRDAVLESRQVDAGLPQGHGLVDRRRRLADPKVICSRLEGG